MSKPRIIAFYLPQFHPIPENDAWWGKGFTEWTNVGKSKPLFWGHYQPKVPADLGYYDLRLPEIQSEQIQMAKKAGIEGFCFYHYWFGNGKILLDRPAKNILANPSLDFPFCFCWANHLWKKQDWNANVSRNDDNDLIKQLYPGRNDFIDHFNYLLPFFKDQRYLKKDGKLIYVIYNIKDIPDPNDFFDTWNQLALEHNLPGFHFVGYRHSQNERLDLSPYSICNGNALEMLLDVKYGKDLAGKILINSRRMLLRILCLPEFVYNYKKIYKKLTTNEIMQPDIYPVLVPNFDHSPRRGKKGIIFVNATPANFKLHLRDVFDRVRGKNHNENLVFLKSWNEWGEGNYVEPDLRYGHGYLDAISEMLKEY